MANSKTTMWRRGEEADRQDRREEFEVDRGKGGGSRDGTKLSRMEGWVGWVLLSLVSRTFLSLFPLPFLSSFLMIPRRHVTVPRPVSDIPDID